MGWFSPVQVFWNNLCFASETSSLITKAGGELETFGVEKRILRKGSYDESPENMTYE